MRLSGFVGPGILALLVLAVAAIITERLGYAGLWRGDFRLELGLRQFGYAVPSLLYCGALWSLRGVPTGAGWLAMAHAVKRAGGFLAAGALAALFAVPLLHRAVGDAPVRMIDLDIASVVLAALGLALAAVAARFEQADAVQADLDEMF